MTEVLIDAEARDAWFRREGGQGTGEDDREGGEDLQMAPSRLNVCKTSVYPVCDA